MADLEDNAAENNGGDSPEPLSMGKTDFVRSLSKPEVVDHINAHEFIEIDQSSKYIGALMSIGISENLVDGGGGGYITDSEVYTFIQAWTLLVEIAGADPLKGSHHRNS